MYPKGSDRAIGMIGVIGFQKGQYELIPDKNVITVSVIIHSQYSQEGTAGEALILALSTILRICQAKPPFGGEPWQFVVTTSVDCKQGQSLTHHFGMVCDRIETFHYRWGCPDIDKMLWSHPIQTGAIDTTGCVDALLQALYDREFDPFTKRIKLHDTEVPRKRLKAAHDSAHTSDEDWTSHNEDSDDDLFFTALEILQSI